MEPGNDKTSFCNVRQHSTYHQPVQFLPDLDKGSASDGHRTYCYPEQSSSDGRLLLYEKLGHNRLVSSHWVAQ